MRKDAEDLHLEMESVAEEVSQSDRQTDSASPVCCLQHRITTASPDSLARVLLSSLFNEFDLIE